MISVGPVSVAMGSQPQTCSAFSASSMGLQTMHSSWMLQPLSRSYVPKILGDENQEYLWKPMADLRSTGVLKASSAADLRTASQCSLESMRIGH